MASRPATARRPTHRVPDDAARRLDRLVASATAPGSQPPHEVVPDGVRLDDDWPDERAASRRAGLVDAVVPQSLRGARWSVGASAVLALLVLVAVAGVAAAVRTAQAAPGVPVPARTVATTAATPLPATTAAGPVPAVTTGTDPAVEPAAGAAQGAATGPPAAGSLVVVHVVGAVGAPGLVTLPVGARVGDALAAAGGAGLDADLARVNLARLVVDGEQVVVPRPGEDVAVAPQAPMSPAGPGAPDAAAGAGGPAPGPLDLNAATLEQLDALPGLGPVLAQRVLDFRTEHGGFTTVDELREVSGIGDAVMADLEPLVRV